MPKFDSTQELPLLMGQATDLRRELTYELSDKNNTHLGRNVSFDKIWNTCRDINVALEKIGFKF